MSVRQVYFEMRGGHEVVIDEPSGLHLALLSGNVACDPESSALWATALQADNDATPSIDLASVWQNVIDGHMTVCEQNRTLLRQYMLARVEHPIEANRRGNALTRIETSVLVRVLGGEQQKLVAAELGMACSTASKWYTHALQKLKLDGGGSIPLPLIIAAQAWANGNQTPVGARAVHFEHNGHPFFLLSVPKPAVDTDTRLTLAEQQVAGLLILGVSRSDIAVHRQTAAQTVACQLRCIFAKYRLTGRHALIRHAVENQWFQPAPRSESTQS